MTFEDRTVVESGGTVKVEGMILNERVMIWSVVQRTLLYF